MTKVTIDRELLERCLPFLSDTPDLVQNGAEALGGELRAILATPVQGEAVAWARQCDLDESDPAIFVAREEVQESGYLVPLYTTAPQPAEVGELAERMKDAERNEKHRNVQQTRYWCNQYKLLARAALAKLGGKA